MKNVKIKCLTTAVLLKKLLSLLVLCTAPIIYSQDIDLYQYKGAVHFSRKCDAEGSQDTFESALKKDPLQVIAIHENDGLDLHQLPNKLSKYTNLRYLGIIGTKIQLNEEDMKIIRCLKNLAYLNLCGNKISHLSGEHHRWLAELNLQSLLLSRNSLTGKLTQIGGIGTLRELHMRKCGLEEVPAEILKLKHLKALDLSQNSFKKLPDGFHIMNLEMLELMKCNNLSDLSNMPTSLLYLELGFTKLTNMPERIYEMRAVRELYLSRTQLSAIDKRVAQLTNLTGIVLDDNKISELPQEFVNLNKLKILQIRGNPIDENNQVLRKLRRNGVIVSPKY